jgi:hypothetical protein
VWGAILRLEQAGDSGNDRERIAESAVVMSAVATPPR